MTTKFEKGDLVCLDEEKIKGNPWAETYLSLGNLYIETIYIGEEGEPIATLNLTLKQIYMICDVLPPAHRCSDVRDCSTHYLKIVKKRLLFKDFYNETFV